MMSRMRRDKVYISVWFILQKHCRDGVGQDSSDWLHVLAHQFILYFVSG
jgi:hypothetical protein